MPVTAGGWSRTISVRRTISWRRWSIVNDAHFLNSMGAINGDDGLDWLTKLLDAYVDAFAERPMYVRSWLVLRSTAHSETGSTFDIEGYDKGSRKIVASWIRRGQRDGSIRPDVSPETAAWHVLALGRGLGEQLLVATGHSRHHGAEVANPKALVVLRWQLPSSKTLGAPRDGNGRVDLNPLHSSKTEADGQHYPGRR